MLLRFHFSTLRFFALCAFKTRQELKAVPRFGEKSFEQAAGFLRIVGGDNPLDASAVHPESYSVVERIGEAGKKELVELLGNTTFLKSVDGRGRFSCWSNGKWQNDDRR